MGQRGGKGPTGGRLEGEASRYGGGGRRGVAGRVRVVGGAC